MSDSSIYELEDIIWDEFAQTDHIVPHSSDENADEHASQVDNCKKPRFEVTGVSSTSDEKYAAECGTQEKGEMDFSTAKIADNTMLEKGSWSQKPDNMFSNSCDNDPTKEVTSLASENTRMSSHCFNRNNIDSLDKLCSDDPMVSSRLTAVDIDSIYPLTHLYQTENDLHFIDDTQEFKESSDLLYYSWPQIENFEDVDRMFRGCDSSFELLGTGNEDEIGWFSASDAVEGFEDASKSNFKFSRPDSGTPGNLPEDVEPSKLKNESSVSCSNTKSASANFKASSQLLETDEPESLSGLTFVNESGQTYKTKDDSIARDRGAEFSEAQLGNSTCNNSQDNRMIHFHNKPQKQKHGKRKDQHVKDCSSLCHTDDQKRKVISLSSGDTPQVCNLVDVQQQQDIGHSSFDYLYSDIYMQPDYHQHADQNTVNATLSGIKSETTIQESIFRTESSHGSNRLQPMENSHDSSFEVTGVVPGDLSGKIHQHQGSLPGFSSNSNNVDLAYMGNPSSAQTGHQYENNGDLKGVNIPPELNSLNLQESSSTNSGLNEVSLDMTSFHQLQQILEQLDLRTKLCIRDSLYRLARSAKQRHNYANLAGGPGDDRNAGLTDGTNTCTGYMDIETDTNPIDRSIAHLLFHRPSDSSVMPSQNAFPKSHTMIPGALTGPPMMVEKLLCHEESAAQTEKDG